MKICKRHLHVSLVLFCVIALWMIVGLFTRRMDLENKDDVFINKMGAYAINKGTYRLNIGKENETLLAYNVTTENGQVLLRNDPEFSFLNWQEWKMYWEKKRERLWIISSDAGCWVWLKNSQGTYEMLRVEKEKLKEIESVPSVICNADAQYFEKMFGN